MIPKILMIHLPKHGSESDGERIVSYFKTLAARLALDEATRLFDTLNLTDDLVQVEIASLKATVETMTCLAGYTRDDIRRCQSRVRLVELKERLEWQEADIAAAKAELKARGIE